MGAGSICPPVGSLLESFSGLNSKSNSPTELSKLKPSAIFAYASGASGATYADFYHVRIWFGHNH